jgi:hypothetical protein
MVATKTTQQQTQSGTNPTRNLYQRLHAAQQNYEPIIKNRVNPHFKSRFADLDAVVGSIEKALSDEGVLIVGLAQPNTADSWLVGIRLVNIDNPEDSTAQFIPCQTFDAQKQGAAITYARRYLLCLMLNLLADDDDDANSVSGIDTGNPASAKTTRNAQTANSDW